MSKKRTLVLVASGVAAILLALWVYEYLQSRPRIKNSQPCWGKLVNIESAKAQWAIENRVATGTVVTAENILPYLRVMPTCHVANAKYILGKVGEETRCTVHGTTSDFKGDQY